jgi:hypothetical protein
VNYLAVFLLFVAKSLFSFLLGQVVKSTSAKQSLTWNGVCIPKLIIKWVNSPMQFKAVIGCMPILNRAKHFERAALEEAGTFISQVFCLIKNHSVSMCKKFSHLVESFNFYLRFADFVASYFVCVFNGLRLLPFIESIPLWFMGVKPFASSLFNNVMSSDLTNTKVNQLPLLESCIKGEFIAQRNSNRFGILQVSSGGGIQIFHPYIMQGGA